jgi:hypothetical protein
MTQVVRPLRTSERGKTLIKVSEEVNDYLFNYFTNSKWEQSDRHELNEVRACERRKRVPTVMMESSESAANYLAEVEGAEPLGGGSPTIKTAGAGDEERPSPEDMRNGMCTVVRQWERSSFVTGWHSGTEWFTSEGEFVYPHVQGTDNAREVERHIIAFMNYHDVSRDAWFFHALLTAAVRHIYAWIRQTPQGGEVLDPRVLEDLRESMTRRIGRGALRWENPTHRSLVSLIGQVPTVFVEDVVKRDEESESSIP